MNHSSRPKCARSRPFGWARGVIPCVLLLAAGASAASGAAPEIRIDPATLYFGAAEPPADAAGTSAKGSRPGRAPETPPAVWHALREKAASRGTVRVLVGVRAAFSPEGRLGNARAVERQRAAIDAAQDAVLGQLGGADAKVHARFEYIPFLALEVDAAALERLAALPEVAGITEEVPDRPFLASSNVVIGTNIAVSQGWTGGGQVVAVLDTGVDKTHPFFAGGKVVSEACYSTTGSGTTSLCPGGVSASTAPGSGVSCTAGVDGCDHGTHVAGIVAGNDGLGPGFGVARGAGIIAIQVFSADCGGFCVGSWPSDQIRGLERVYELADDFDIAAVNMSLGGWGYSSRESCDAGNAARKAAIDNLRSIDVATVIASGNFGDTGSISAPACISSAVSVGATTDADAVAWFSNIAAFLDLLAPGVNVTSSVPGGGTAAFDGTSMAAPHVAGAWAVLKQANPGATVSDVLALLRATGTPVNERGVSGMRRIHLGKAVLAGPSQSQAFTIHNDGTAVLSVLGMELETPVPWIRWVPEAPFDLAPGGSREVAVTIDFSRAPAGESTHRLVVSSTDADESPYPGAVFLVVDKQPCHPLTRSRTGQGSQPMPTPSTSPGCPAGQYHAGEVVHLAASPATGWEVEAWSGTANDASTATTNTVTMPAAAHAVSVAYTAPCFPLTLGHTGSGSDPVASPTHSDGCPAGQYHLLETIELTASPADGWRVGTWSGTDDDASRRKINQLTMPESAAAVSVTYLQGTIDVLLVNADGSSFFSLYTEALDALGVAYDVWDTGLQGLPDLGALDTYPKVVWSNGPIGGGFSSTEEAVMAAYLDAGGRLFLADQEYIWVRGLTPFMANYLGVGSHDQDSSIYQVTGQGSLGALGPYDLSFSFTNYSDILHPGAGAESVFLGLSPYYPTAQSAGVAKVAPSYRTVFLGFPFEALPTAEARRHVLGAGLDFLGTIFDDVRSQHWAKKWIEAIYHAGVTTGCASNPLRYCPGDLVGRDQMAVFLLRGLEGGSYVPPPCTTSPFSDVAAGSVFCPWIQELAARGVTLGCGGGKYCPAGVVSREQMAIFLMRAIEGGAYSPAPCIESPFLDVPAASPTCGWIRDLAALGVTSGCGGGRFCPSDPTNRAEMAVFLVRAFSIPLP